MIVFPTAHMGGAPDGMDYALSLGQSNEVGFGSTYSAGTDAGGARVYQYGYTSHALSSGGARDPLDHPDTSNQTPSDTYIGHISHFMKDYYVPHYLRGNRKAVIYPGAYGGTRIQDSGFHGWAAVVRNGSSPAVGTLLTDAVTRGNELAAMSGVNTPKLISWHQGEGDFASYPTGTLSLATWYRWGLIEVFRYLRAHLTGGANVPIVLGRMSDWTINTGNATYYADNAKRADKIHQAIVRRMPYVGLVDTISPSPLGSSDVHFSAADQRTYATRMQAAYEAARLNTNFPTYPLWDDIDYLQTSLGYASGYTITNSGRDISGDANSGWKSAIATMPNSSGNVYVEVEVAAVASNTNLGFLGLCNQQWPFDTYPGSAAETNGGHDCAAFGVWGGQPAGLSSIGSAGWTLRAAYSTPAHSAGTIWSFLLKRSRGEIYVARNGTWVNSGDPSTNTNPFITGVPTTDLLFLMASIYTGTGNTYRIRAKASEFAYSALAAAGTPWSPN